MFIILCANQAIYLLKIRGFFNLQKKHSECRIDVEKKDDLNKQRVFRRVVKQ